MGEGVRVIGWGNGVGVDVARSICVGRGAVARGIFLHPLSSWITKNPFYLSHIHVILIPGNIPKTNLEVPHFLRPCLARFTTKTSQKWAKTRKKRYLCGQIHNPKLVFF